MKRDYVLITGSSKGLGKELALLFASNSYNIILHGRNKLDLQNVKKEIIKKGVDCIIVTGDIKKDETIDKLYLKSKEKDISIFINNAGVHCPHLPLEKINDVDIDDLLNTNLIAPIKLTQRVYRDFFEKKSGVIININSLSGLKSQYHRTLYCSSKWGLKGFSDTLRMEAEDNNIRIIDVYPGRIKTKKEFKEGMNTKEVAQKIYDDFKNNDIKIINLFGER